MRGDDGGGVNGYFRWALWMTMVWRMGVTVARGVGDGSDAPYGAGGLSSIPQRRSGTNAASVRTSSLLSPDSPTLIDLPVSFAHPWWLLLLCLVPVFLYVERHSMTALPQGRRRLSRLLRLISVVAIILALAGLQYRRISDQLTVVFAIDSSDSTRGQLESLLEDLKLASSTMRREDQAGVIVFGRDAYVESSPGTPPRFEELQTVVDTGHTNIAAAVRLALAIFPDDSQKRLVMVTDGNQNLGDALEAATAAAGNNIPIDVIPLSRRIEQEVLVEDVNLPSSINRDEPFEMRVTLRATTEGTARLRLFRNNQSVGSREEELTPGKNVISFRLTEVEEGFHTYQVFVDSLFDTLRENNTGSALIRVFGQPKILLVGAADDREYLAKAIAGANDPTQGTLLLEEMDQVPWRRTRLENYDAIVLANHAADANSADQLQLLHDYVRDQAGGLLMVGGPNSFGPGGYGNTPVEEAMPVNMELTSKRHFPSLSMALVIDKSGSMADTAAGRTLLELAAEACMQAVQLLTPRDQIMVIAFDGAPKRVVDLMLVGEQRPWINEQIASLRPGGGTDMYPAYEAAVQALMGTHSQLKHIILLTDGMTNPANFPALTEQAAAAGITVSGMAVGQGADTQLLHTISTLGGGRFYHIIDATQIPRTFARETYIVQRAYLIEEPFFPAIHQENQIIAGLRDFPEVRGYVATEAKDRAELVLLTHKGDPLLAVWRYGLGKALAFTSDAKDVWLQNWIGWEGYNQFWSQAVRWAMRSQAPSVLYPTMTIDQGQGHIVVDAVGDDNQFINFLRLQAIVSSPEGSRTAAQEVELVQTGPGRYEASFEARDSGAYLVRIHGGEEQGIMPTTTSRVISYPAEYREIEPNMLLINQLVDRTQGRLDPALADLFSREQRQVARRFDLWFYLLLIAVALLPFDIAARRIFFDEEQIAAMRAFVRRLVPSSLTSPVPAGAGTAASTMDALRRTKRDVAQRRLRRGSGEADDAPVTSLDAPTSSASAQAQGIGATRPPAQPPVGVPSGASAPPTTGYSPAPRSSASGPAPAGEASGSAFDALRRLRQGGGSAATPPAGASPGATPSQPPAQPRIFIAKDRVDKPGEASDGDGTLSYTERLMRAREKARRDRGQSDGDAS